MILERFATPAYRSTLAVTLGDMPGMEKSTSWSCIVERCRNQKSDVSSKQLPTRCDPGVRC